MINGLPVLIDYVESTLKNLGYTVHDEAFGDEGLPISKIDKTASFTLQSGMQTKLNHAALHMTYNFSIRIYKRAFRDEIAAIKELALDGESLIKTFLNSQNRIGQTFQSELSSFSIEPIEEQNERTQRAIIDISFTIVLGTV